MVAEPGDSWQSAPGVWPTGENMQQRYQQLVGGTSVQILGYSVALHKLSSIDHKLPRFFCS